MEVARRSQDVSRLESFVAKSWTRFRTWSRRTGSCRLPGESRRIGGSAWRGARTIRDHRRQATAGQLAPIEVVAAQTTRWLRVECLRGAGCLDACRECAEAIDVAGRGAALWASALHPVTPPDTGDATPDPCAQSRRRFSAERPEIAQREVAAQINRADQKLSREQLKPQLDLSARYARAGLAGDTVTTGANCSLKALLRARAAQ